jgi:Collagen triple helix repeat (20 copies)
MTSNGKHEESSLPPPDSADLLLDAWRQALGDTLGAERASWVRERERMQAQADAIISQTRADVVERLAQFDRIAAQAIADVTKLITERLALVRDGEPGPIGKSGEQGPQGEKGEAGQPGEKGEKGDPGDRGDHGERGEKGDAGEKGDQGLQGSEGQHGEKGDPGPQGPQGLAGDHGEKGDKGDGGDQGPQGLVGAAGAPGARGDPGERGAAGPQGEKGLTGDRGEQGPPGRLPIAKLWQQDEVCYAGDVVIHDGGTWQALRDTGLPPGGKDWACLASAGRDARTPQVKGTFDPEAAYVALDIVALNANSFIARRDNPGPCPGEGWQVMTQGKRGVAGERGAQGERGTKGDPGERGATIKGWKLDRERYVATPVMSDGSAGPSLELRGLFEQFQHETA